MSARLYMAAREGNTSMLKELLEEDPVLLNRVLPPFSETPLHVAALAGRAEFTQQLLSRAPWLVRQQSDRCGLNSLHMASAQGHADVVSVFLDFDHKLALIGDSQGFGPLHYAVYYGRVDVARMLVCRDPMVLKQVNLKGENALHIAVKSKQYQVMAVLMELLKNLGNEFSDEVVRCAKDVDGHTFLQLAAASKQSEVMDLVRSYNASGGDENGITIEDYNGIQYEDVGNDSSTRVSNGTKIKEKEEREAFLVVGGLVATVTFQALVSPPQSIWKDSLLSSSPNPNLNWMCLIYLSTNSAAFFASCLGFCDSTRLTSWVMISLAWAVFCYFMVLISMIKIRATIGVLMLVVLYMSSSWCSSVLCSFFTSGASLVVKVVERLQMSQMAPPIPAPFQRSILELRSH